MSNKSRLFFNEIHNRIVRNTRKAVRETLQLVEKESIKSFNESKKPGAKSTGMLISSFEKSPVRNLGNQEFSGMVFVGGPSAPYAIFVDKHGWNTKNGHKDGYEFMQAGLDKAELKVSEIYERNMLSL